MNGKQIGDEIEAACKATESRGNIRSGGNIGMAFIASAISEHAAAVADLARAIAPAKAPPQEFAPSMIVLGNFSSRAKDIVAMMDMAASGKCDPFKVEPMKSCLIRDLARST